MSLQAEFDDKYISSVEICQALGVNRTTVFNGIRAGKLPESIHVRRSDGAAHIVLFLRTDAVPMMEAWAKDIASRKGL